MPRTKSGKVVPVARQDEKFRVTSKITSKWQITVPKAVREELDLRPGDQLAFVGTPRAILVKRGVDLSFLNEWVGYFSDLAGTNVDELIEEMRGR